LLILKKPPSYNKIIRKVRVVSKGWRRGLYWKSRWPAVTDTPLAQKILKFEGSFGEILSIFPLSK
jgi:hypothetical protein